MRTVSAAEVDRALDYRRLIERLRQAFRDPCAAPLRHRHALARPSGAEASILVKPAWRDDGESPIVVKIVNVFPDNAALGLPSVHGLVAVFDGATGAPLAAVDGQALTVRRTAAASALAADYLAREDAETLLVVGTGRLAPALAEAHALVRPIRRTLVWGRDPAKAEALAARLRAAGRQAEPAPDLARAAAAADMVSAATLAREPLIRGDWLRPGAHIDLVGGFRPDMREADDRVLQRARVFVDTRAGAVAEAGDIAQPLARGAFAEADIEGDLSELCAGAAPGRRSAAEITVFKSVGTAVEDHAAAGLVLEAVS